MNKKQTIKNVGLKTTSTNSVEGVRDFILGSISKFLHPWWVTGISDAEGNFSIFKQKTSKGYKWTLAFKVTQKEHSSGILHDLRRFFNCGHIHIDNRKENAYKFNVNRLEDILNIIIPHFDKVEPIILTNEWVQAFIDGEGSWGAVTSLSIPKFRRSFSTSSNSYPKDLNPVIVYYNAAIQKNQILENNKGKCGIYRWTNILNGNSYVGSGINLSNRLIQYYSRKFMETSLKRSKSAIYSALLNHGYSKFSLEILEYCEPSNVIAREQYYIDLLCPEYNLLKTAGSRFGSNQSEETKQKMSDSLIPPPPSLRQGGNKGRK
jgi:hypothetical protein